jgi:hypothetical protein
MFLSTEGMLARGANQQMQGCRCWRNGKLIHFLLRKSTKSSKQ